MKTSVSIYYERGRPKPWRVCWWDPTDWDTGQQRRGSRKFKCRQEAVAFKAKRELANRDGPIAYSGLTLGRLCEEYSRTRLPQLGYVSKERYGSVIDQLLEHFGKLRPLGEIRQTEAERFMASRRRLDGRPGRLSNASISQILTYCRAIFNAAVDWKWVSTSPFHPSKDRGNTVLRKRSKPSVWQHITPGQFLTFLHKVPEVRRRAGYWLMYGCGLRAGEVYNLTADCIDLVKKIVVIRSRAGTPDVPPFSIKGEEASAEPKDRAVPIPELAIGDIGQALGKAFRSGGFVVLTPERFEYVQEQWRLARAGKPFGSSGRLRPWQNRDMVNNWLNNTKRAIKRAGLELSAPFKLHTFRKCFGQNMADAGVPPRTLAEFMGHADVRVTMEYYNRATDANRCAAAASSDQMFRAAQAEGEVQVG